MATTRRGRETAIDMVRSLGLVLAIVIGVVVLAHPRSGDESRLRIVDPSGDVKAFAADAPQVPVPGPLPRWQPTVTDYDRQTSTLRVGWVTPEGEYAEYAATTAPTPTFVRDFTGTDTADGSIDLGGTSWTRYRDDEAISLVRTVGGATVVLGTKRESASLDELRVLAAALTA